MEFTELSHNKYKHHQHICSERDPPHVLQRCLLARVQLEAGLFPNQLNSDDRMDQWAPTITDVSMYTARNTSEPINREIIHFIPCFFFFLMEWNQESTWKLDNLTFSLNAGEKGSLSSCVTAEWTRLNSCGSCVQSYVMDYKNTAYSLQWQIKEWERSSSAEQAPQGWVSPCRENSKR